jgi:transcriptional regulator with XRE-family HTH domain
MKNVSAKKRIAELIKEGRALKGYTQQELSDLTGISLRSVQRIENEEVLPRAYTIRILAEKLEITDKLGSSLNDGQESQPATNEHPVNQSWLNKPRKIILSAGIGLILVLGAFAFLAQSVRFPETQFESSLFWLGIITAYTIILYRLWK